MTKGASLFPISSDTPKDDPEEDLFGYSDFSQQLAKLVKSQSFSEEFVIGIYGPWGSGKSTILNFLNIIFEKIATNIELSDLTHGGFQMRATSYGGSC